MYNLHLLGWHSFQRLCHTITGKILGQTVESFLDTHDGGRDGAFSGKWSSAGQDDLFGQFVIQCKFTSKACAVLKASSLTDEIKKAGSLVTQDLCDSYVLMTSAGTTGTENSKIKSLFRAVGVKNILILDSTWINRQIAENKELRILVPRVYGLGDLSEILDERAYTQARAILETMKEDLAKVIITDAYKRAVEAINEHSFVLLIGEPAAGKTTIASLLAMAALDQWGASLLKLERPSRVTEHWNPNESEQFFWLDDAFGVTQYEKTLVDQWNHIFPQIQAMLRRGAKIVMTSRDYIYNRARNDLKGSAFPLLNESQVVVDVHELSIDERRQILYNHVKLGNQDLTFRSKIKPYLEIVASHERFIPEIARRLADRFFTENLSIERYTISQFVEKREQLLREVLCGLDVDSRAALALIFLRGGRLESPIDVDPLELEALERLNSDLGRCIAALESLRGSLVVLSRESEVPYWQFKHPTIGDAYASILAESPEHLGTFIHGSRAERLVVQITCGDLGMENAVIVPKSLYPQVLAKVMGMRSRNYPISAVLSTATRISLVHRFLAYRCSKEFLKIYLQDCPGLPDEVSEPGLYLHAVSEVDIAKRLHEFGLLPEGRRRKFVETVSNYALEGQDAGAISDMGIRCLFTEGEFDELLARIETELLPRLDEVRNEWEYNYHPSEDPEDYMRQWLDFLECLQEVFGYNEDLFLVVENEMSRTADWIQVNSTDEPIVTPRQLETVGSVVGLQSKRSIFDDIDADESSEDE